MSTVWMGTWDDYRGSGERQSYPDEALEELRGTKDAAELCRLLLSSPWGWGSSTRPAEVVELLRGFTGTSGPTDRLVALLLCTCRRWDRVTSKLIAQLEASSLLDDGDLDELAESFLSGELNVQCYLGWLSPEWLELDLGTGQTERVRLPDDTLTTTKLTVEPPLRRWAAARVLRSRPEWLSELLALAGRLPRLEGYAVVQGLLDAAGVLREAERHRLLKRGLATGRASVRLAALNLLCADKGPEAARRRARSDGDAKVRAWRPPSDERHELLD
jgi:hypothetical protein